MKITTRIAVSNPRIFLQKTSVKACVSVHYDEKKRLK